MTHRTLIDVQPIRDVSLLADIFLLHHFGLKTFHLTNFIIWLGILILTMILLSRLFRLTEIHYIVFALFSAHPVFANSVAWISARKHLLAAFFILGATLSWVRTLQRESNQKPL